MDERVHARRRIAEAVYQLVGQVVRLFLGADERDAPVDVHALLLRGYIPIRYIRRNGKVCRAFRPRRNLDPARLQHRFAEKLHIHIVADVDHMPRLLRAEQIARAAYLKVAHRYLEAGAEGREVADGVEPLLGDLGQYLVAPEGKIRRGAPRRAAHAAAYLMQLRKAKVIRIFDYQGVDIRDIYARLDDGRADKHLNLPVCDVFHHVCEHVFVHLPVCHADGHILQQVGYFLCRAFDVVYAVMKVVHLTAALKLAAYRVGDDVPVVLHHEGLHRQSVLRRLLKRGHIAYAGHGHVQRARDRRRGEGQHVHSPCKLLDVLLVRHAEALLLVHDQQAEILELHILAEQSVRADNKVALSGRKV